MDDLCRASSRCQDGRWACSVEADWLNVAGLPPWGDDDEIAVLAFLATARADEFRVLGEDAWSALNTGAWQGVKTQAGGWRDGPPHDEREARWRDTAHRFWVRAESGDFTLDEGMLDLARWDLARELAWRRGWCPGLPG